MPEREFRAVGGSHELLIYGLRLYVTDEFTGPHEITYPEGSVRIRFDHGAELQLLQAYVGDQDSREGLDEDRLLYGAMFSAPPAPDKEQASHYAERCLPGEKVASAERFSDETRAAVHIKRVGDDAVHHIALADRLNARHFYLIRMNGFSQAAIDLVIHGFSIFPITPEDILPPFERTACAREPTAACLSQRAIAEAEPYKNHYALWPMFLQRLIPIARDAGELDLLEHYYATVCEGCRHEKKLRYDIVVALLFALYKEQGWAAVEPLVYTLREYYGPVSRGRFELDDEFTQWLRLILARGDEPAFDSLTDIISKRADRVLEREMERLIELSRLEESASLYTRIDGVGARYRTAKALIRPSVAAGRQDLLDALGLAESEAYWSGDLLIAYAVALAEHGYVKAAQDYLKQVGRGYAPGKRAKAGYVMGQHGYWDAAFEVAGGIELPQWRVWLLARLMLEADIQGADERFAQARDAFVGVLEARPDAGVATPVEWLLGRFLAHPERRAAVMESTLAVAPLLESVERLSGVGHLREPAARPLARRALELLEDEPEEQRLSGYLRVANSFPPGDQEFGRKLLWQGLEGLGRENEEALRAAFQRSVDHFWEHGLSESLHGFITTLKEGENPDDALFGMRIYYAAGDALVDGGRTDEARPFVEAGCRELFKRARPDSSTFELCRKRWQPQYPIEVLLELTRAWQAEHRELEEVTAFAPALIDLEVKHGDPGNAVELLSGVAAIEHRLTLYRLLIQAVRELDEVE